MTRVGAGLHLSALTRDPTRDGVVAFRRVAGADTWVTPGVLVVDVLDIANDFFRFYRLR